MKYISFYIVITIMLISSCKKDDIIVPVLFNNLDNYSISSLATDISNNLWIATDTGLFKTVSSGFEMVDIGLNGPITSLAFDKDINSLWIGTISGLYLLDFSNADSTAIPIALDKLSNPGILSAYIDENSVRWFGTETGFTRNEEEIWQKDMFKMNVSGAVTKLQFNEYAVNSIGMWDGDYYFATSGNKLWRTSNWKASVDAFTGATMWDPPYNGFAIADTMYAVFIDSKGQQWFGGKEGVQVHIGHEPKENNTSYYDELVNPIVHCIAEDSKGNIWVGTENGISVFDGEKWNKSDIVLNNQYINAILFSENIVWIGTKKGLYRLNIDNLD